MERYLNYLYKLCNKASKNKEVPVAAIVYDESSGKIISKAYNKREKSNNILYHAEILAIIKANKCLKSKYLSDYSLLVTLEPCEMCKTVIKEARLKNVYYLVKRDDNKLGYQKTNFEKLQNKDIWEQKFKQILTDFFKKRR